jgi:hypothetical protein
MERLEREALRPRQVRYQAALRPDSNSYHFSALVNVPHMTVPEFARMAD